MDGVMKDSARLPGFEYNCTLHRLAQEEALWVVCSCLQLRGVSRWFNPLVCDPDYPELSNSYSDILTLLVYFFFSFYTCIGWC